MTPGPEASRARVVILQAATRWHGVRLHDRQLAEHLAVHVPVLYLEPPASPRRRDVAGPPAGRLLDPVAPGVSRVGPVRVPGHSRPGVARLTTLLTARLLRRALGELGDPPAALLGSSTEVILFGQLGEAREVHWAQDDFVGNAELIGSTARRVLAGEQRIARVVRTVVAANPLVAQRWRDRGIETALVPYGADVDAYARVDDVPTAPDVCLPAPIAGFVGQLGDRVDWPLLAAVADRGVSLLLVGPLRDEGGRGALEDLVARPNVQWVGERPFEALPGYLRAIDVGLVPYADIPFNRASFPLKTLEYLAAGRRVVSTDLPATRWLDSPLVVTGSWMPDRFSDAVVATLRRPVDAGERAARRAFATAHSWAARASDLARVLGVDGPNGPLVSATQRGVAF